ncbi:aminoglycoside phosphotransferase family protein [bacterium]|nr:aminoglycoside phosphotransferase family protein [bacterium]
MLPVEVLAFADRGPDWADFVDHLPRLVRDISQEWQLTPDGPALHGYTALVLPVIASTGPAMLKIGFPHDESEHEHLALQHWHGHAAVRLLRADPRRGALLLERLDTQDLTNSWDLDACQIVGSLYKMLHVPALPQLRTLTSYISPWTKRLAALPRSAPLPRSLIEHAVSLGRDFATDTATNGTLIHGDLHYANVLASLRTDGPEWLAIDPKPVSGDPHYEIAPLLWNRWDELANAPSGQSVRDGIRARFHATIDAARLDEDRARDWVIVRMLHNALFELEEHPAGGPSQPNADYLTLCVTLAKAVQD